MEAQLPLMRAMFRAFLVTMTCLLSLCLVACDSDSDAGDDTADENTSRSLRIVNAVAGSLSIGWELAGSDQGPVEYGRASAAGAFIDGEKELTFYQIDVNGDLEYLDLTYDYEVEGDSDVLLILYGALDDVRLELIEADDFDLDEGFGRVGAINFSTARPAVDMYLTRDDDGIFSASPLTSIADSTFSGMIDLEEGEYRLRLTAIGDKTVVFDADTVDIREDTNHFYIIMDFALDSDSVLVLEIQGDGLTRQLLDESTPARLRLFNGIADYSAVDLYFGDTSGQPSFENIQFREMTDYLDVEPGSYSVNVTPTGVKDTFFYEAEISVVTGSYLSLIVAGLTQAESDARDISGNLVADEVQPISTGAQVSFIHASTSNEAVDVYFLVPGQPLDDAGALVSGLSQFLTFDFEEEAGDYQIVLVQSSNEAVILGPVPVSIADSEIVEIVFTDSPGGGTPGALTVVRTSGE
jgi:hypothetical protein